jgi:iron complex transport system ATP-binding protein
VDGLQFGYHGNPVFRDVGCSVDEHELLAILGPNGAGKTTLLKCLNGVLKPRGGTVLVDGSQSLSLSRRRRAQIIAMVSQRGEASRITVYDMVLLGRKPHLQWGATQADHEKVASVIRMLKLEHLALRYVDEISGGELQMVQVARALAQEPRVLLLDEPTSSLDIRNQLRIMDALAHIITSHPMVAVMAIHDLQVALRYADKFALMQGGTLHAVGGREIITRESIRAVYGIEAKVVDVEGNLCVIPMGVV